jgi:hypothetical protein
VTQSLNILQDGNITEKGLISPVGYATLDLTNKREANWSEKWKEKPKKLYW